MSLAPRTVCGNVEQEEGQMVDGTEADRILHVVGPSVQQLR